MALSDGFNSMLTELRRIFTGYNDSYAEDKKAADSLESVSGIDIPDSARNGSDGLIGDIIPNGLAGIKDSIDWVIVGLFGLLIYLFVFKE